MKVKKSLGELCEGKDKDPPTVRFVAERQFAEMAPPLHRTDITTGGDKLSHLTVEFVDTDEPGGAGDE